MSTREEYVSIPEAAEILNLKRNRVGVLCREGRFPGAVKIANNWVIPREAVTSHRPLPPGVKSLKTKLVAEKAGYLAKAKGAPISTQGRRRTITTMLAKTINEKRDTWAELDKIVLDMAEKPRLEDFPRSQLGRELVNVEEA